MTRETVLAMARALPNVREDGDSLLFDDAWEVTLHVGRNGGPMSIQQINKLTLHGAFVLAETHKGQRIAITLDEVRGLGVDPASGERRGRKTGFA